MQFQRLGQHVFGDVNTGSSESSTRPASMREMSSTSLMRPNRCRPALTM